MVVIDHRNVQGWISYSHLRDASELWHLLKSRGITHLVYPDGQRLPLRWNNTVLFGELFHHHALDVKRFGKLVLGALPPSAPPKTAPYFVLVRKLRGYPDGLYRVEQLDIDNNHPQSFKPAPRPVTPLSTSNVAELLGQAQAVALGRGGLKGDGAAELARSFTRVEVIDGHELHLRKRK
jgi:hypothetical protein